MIDGVRIIYVERKGQRSEWSELWKRTRKRGGLGAIRSIFIEFGCWSLKFIKARWRELYLWLKQQRRSNNWNKQYTIKIAAANKITRKKCQKQHRVLQNHRYKEKNPPPSMKIFCTNEIAHMLSHGILILVLTQNVNRTSFDLFVHVFGEQLAQM